MAAAGTRTKVFVSYSHKDRRWLDELRTYLAPLEGVLDLWDDRRQEPGRRWLPQIEQALREAKVGLLLISPDFMASRFIQEHEVPRLLRRAEDDGVPLLCVYVRAALVERGVTSRDPVSGETRTVRWPEFQWLNDPERALDGLPKPRRGRELVEIAKRILAVVQAPEAAPADLTPYFVRLRRDTGRIELRGLGDKEARRVALERVYTKLRVTAAGRAGDAVGGKRGAEDADERPIERTTVELKDLLGRPDDLVLVGDPGAGKTTFLRFVALNLTRAWLDDEREACLARLGFGADTEPPFPVLVSLGAFGQHLEKQASLEWPERAPEQFYRWLDVQGRGYDELPSDFLRRRVRRGGCLLLLDGLDEVPGDDLRERVGAILEEVLAEDRGSGRGNRHVVTCRTRAYQGRAQLGPEFTRATLVDFGSEEIEEFVTQWSRALHAEDGGGSAEASAHARELLEAIRAHPHVQPLCANPLLLTILAVVHWNERRLPEGRAELYRVALDYLLRSRATHSPYELARRRDGLREIAKRLFEDPQGVRKSLDRFEAAQAAAAVLQVSAADALAFVDDEGLHSGILMSRTTGEVEFWHPTFGEYLAAEAFAGTGDAWSAIAEHVFDPRWNEVVLLLAGCLRLLGPRLATTFIQRVLASDTSLPGRARAVGLVGRILRDLRPYGGDASQGTEYAGALREVLAIFEPSGPEVSERVRIEVGEALGQAGDPRISENDDENRVLIQEGTFLMGSTDGQGDERPVHRVAVSSFWIDRYPVTVSQFQRFMLAAEQGYLNRNFWSGTGWSEREARGWVGPRGWDEQQRHLNRPVVSVSWYEAEAYCAWLSATTGLRVRLPTEAEWELAARGELGRAYTWGNATPTDRHMNVAMQAGNPTPVGVYPLGATPEGVQDLLGNVLEWCGDWYDWYIGRVQNNPSGPPRGRCRALRGGGFYIHCKICRAAHRNYHPPEEASRIVGFRCVAPASGQ
jgi:formylglycine-generating enzyme required for sulfatase activity